MFSGFIVQALGMPWAFWIVAMFIGANLVCMFLWMPETKYTGPRPSIYETNPAPQNAAKGMERIGVDEDLPMPQKSWMEELKFWSKGDPNVNIVHVFLRPFVLLAYPTVVWSCFVYGLALSWNVILGAIVAQLFTPPPYGFNSNAQGLFFLSPFIGSLFGVFFSGPCGDWIANYFTKRNNGIREPEMRLPTCLVAAFFTFFGALWFALSYEHQLHWAMPVVGAGILSVGSQMGTTLGMNYALDCHQEVSFDLACIRSILSLNLALTLQSQLSVEIMVTIAALKSAIAWIWTWVINDFIAATGILTVFMVIAAINAAIYLSFVIFYFKGKQIRVWLYHADLFRAAGLE